MDQNKPVQANLSSIYSDNTIQNVTQGTSSSAQNVLDKFIDGLKAFNLTDVQIQEIVSEHAHLIVEMIMQQIYQYMDEKDVEEWNKFVDGGANEAQQLIVLEKFYQKKSGESLQDLEERIVSQVLAESVKQFNQDIDINNKFSKLSDDQVKQVEDLLAQGKFDEAQSIVDGV